MWVIEEEKEIRIEAASGLEGFFKIRYKLIRTLIKQMMEIYSLYYRLTHFILKSKVRFSL